MSGKLKFWADDFKNETNDKTMFSLVGIGFKQVDNWSRLFSIVFSLVLTIFSINSIWTFYGTSETVISGWLNAFFPLEIWFWVFGGLFVFLLGYALAKRDKMLRNLVAMLIAFNVGITLSEFWQATIDFPSVEFPFETIGDAGNSLYFRLFFLVPVIPMFLVYWLLIRKNGQFPLRVGDLSVKTKLFFPRGKKQNSWKTILVRYWIFVVLPVFLLMQITVGFEPILSGKLFIFLVPILILALFNAFAEELLIQGFILPNVVSSLRPAFGVFLMGMFFGLLHFGASPDVIAGLPQALIIGFFAWMGAKAVVETGGIGFSILAHMGADVAIFSSSFI